VCGEKVLEKEKKKRKASDFDDREAYSQSPVKVLTTRFLPNSSHLLPTSLIANLHIITMIDTTTTSTTTRRRRRVGSARRARQQRTSRRCHSLLASIPENDPSSSEQDELSDKSRTLENGSPTSVRQRCLSPFDYPAASAGFHRNSSLDLSSRSGSDSPTEDEDALLLRSLVNSERTRRGLEPYSSSPSLHRLATKHAQCMAARGTVHHSAKSLEELMARLSSETVAENIQRGDSCVQEMHRDTMLQRGTVNRANVLSSHFSEFGAAVATGADGKLYICQLFRG
jgi:uncharacterized protein YkwD